jgi:hypothetical protein
MQRPSSPGPRPVLPVRPVTFEAGAHSLAIAFVSQGRWTVAVDGQAPSGTYATQVEAWEAGVRTAALLDQRPSP